jgi:TrmH family RNA methyltransferase
MISSIHNPLVKQMRKLHKTKERKEQGLFLLEGTHLIESALHCNCSLTTVCCTALWQERYPQLWQQLHSRAARIETVTEEVLKAIATTVNPDGIVATASPQSKTIDRVKLGLVLERLQDPGNLGTIIRTAVATGTDGLWISEDSVDIDNPKVLRASAGAWFELPMAVSPNLPDLVQFYRQEGLQIVATLPQAKKTYWEIDFTRPTLILLGNEGAGLTEQLASLAQEKVTIPLAGGVESLNVAIATALLLYEAQRQKREV